MVVKDTANTLLLDLRLETAGLSTALADAADFDEERVRRTGALAVDSVGRGIAAAVVLLLSVETLDSRARLGDGVAVVEDAAADDEGQAGGLVEAAGVFASLLDLREALILLVRVVFGQEKAADGPRFGGEATLVESPDEFLLLASLLLGAAPFLRSPSPLGSCWPSCLLLPRPLENWSPVGWLMW